MDIISLINSKDIQKHLRDIGYKFNSLEAAWLIYECKRLCYEEKKELWLELIATMQDCEVPSSYNCKGWRSLHTFLKEYIDLIDREIKEFFSEAPLGKYLYRYSYLYKGDSSWCENYESIYPSLGKCLEAFESHAGDLEQKLTPKDAGVFKYRLKRQALMDPEEYLEIELLADGRLINIIFNSKRSENDDKLYYNSFDGLWFDIPTPFKKGNILWVPENKDDICWDCDGGFVLDSLSSWTANEGLKKYWGASDMIAWGYFLNPNGTVYHECRGNYMDLEYYNGPYEVDEKILLALSKFIKGEIEVDLLLCAYRKTLLDITADDIMLKSWYSKDTLKELGLG